MSCDVKTQEKSEDCQKQYNCALGLNEENVFKILYLYCKKQLEVTKYIVVISLAIFSQILEIMVFVKEKFEDKSEWFIKAL